jgi:hypothetical protein
MNMRTFLSLGITSFTIMLYLTLPQLNFHPYFFFRKLKMYSLNNDNFFIVIDDVTWISSFEFCLFIFHLIFPVIELKPKN